MTDEQCAELLRRQVEDLTRERYAASAVALDYARERDEAETEAERLRGLLGEVLDCFDPMTDAGATGWIDQVKDARIRREAGLT